MNYMEIISKNLIFFFSVQVQSIDVIKPSVPIITNVSCYNTGKIYVEWTKPLRHSGLKSKKKKSIFRALFVQDIFWITHPTR